MVKIILLALFCLPLLAGCSFFDRPGGDRDEHGCLGSGGYRWCAATEQCERDCPQIQSDRR